MSGNGEMVYDGENLVVTRKGPVATLRWRHSEEVAQRRAGRTMPDVKLETAEAIRDLGSDDTVRVVVVTGTRDEFKVAPRKSPWVESRGNAASDWELIKGVTRVLQAFVELDQPIVASINGAAVGWGSSIAYACDFIFAANDAQFIDHHLGMGEEGYGRPDFGVVPGDGGLCFVPLFMSPPIAREYLMLGRPLTGRELAEMHAINGAVPADELEGTVDAFVERLLARPQYALAWTKRIYNRRVREQLDLTLDSSLAYEMLNFYQGAAERGQRGSVEQAHGPLEKR